MFKILMVLDVWTRVLPRLQDDRGKFIEGFWEVVNWTGSAIGSRNCRVMSNAGAAEWKPLRSIKDVMDIREDRSSTRFSAPN